MAAVWGSIILALAVVSQFIGVTLISLADKYGHASVAT